MSGLLKYFTPSLMLRRSVGNNQFNWFGEGIQYPGFKYYPRHSDFKDPPFEATKLFKVQRIKPLKGAAFWEKNILREFKLDGRLNSFAVIKNIPENNQRLWRVKHLIKIVPITFPDGFPQDTHGTYLQENGELRVVKKVPVEEKRLVLTENFQKSPKKMDGDTLRRNSRMKWMNPWE